MKVILLVLAIIFLISNLKGWKTLLKSHDSLQEEYKKSLNKLSESEKSLFNVVMMILYILYGGLGVIFHIIAMSVIDQVLILIWGSLCVVSLFKGFKRLLETLEKQQIPKFKWWEKAMIPIGTVYIGYIIYYALTM